MSLDFNVGEIENYEENYSYGNNWHPVTTAIVYATIPVGMYEITEKNWKEFFRRVFIWEKVAGPYLTNHNTETDEVTKRPLTPEDIKGHIGLSTNASPKTNSQFNKGIIEFFDFDVKQKINATSTV